MKKFGLESTDHMKTPIGINLKLTKDESSFNVDPTLYKSVIGSLLYLTANCPNICYGVGVCARYQPKPKKSHLAIVKRII